MEAEAEERKQILSTYKDDIDYKSLNEYVDKLSKLVFNSSSRYYIKFVMHIFDGVKLEIYDKELQKIVYMGILKEDGSVTFRDVEDYELNIK